MGKTPKPFSFYDTSYLINVWHNFISGNFFPNFKLCHVLRNLIMRNLLPLALLSALSLPSPANAACGKASFYGLGDGYAGRTTASGEVMNPDAMTTAHKSLPFGTRLLVTNPVNGRQVSVRVNDRGPFVGGRVLDLSPQAFTKIAPVSSGIANVCYRRVV